MPFRHVQLERMKRDLPYVAVVVRRAISGVRLNTIAVLFLALVMGIFLVVYYQRIEAADNRNKNLACLALHYTPPTSSFYKDLRSEFPNCPPYTGNDKPLSGPTTTGTPRPSLSPTSTP